MTAREVKNLPASVRQRLANLAQTRGEPFQYVAEHYAIERFLYRLSVSAHSDRFMLKGALLFKLWHMVRVGPTQCIDTRRKDLSLKAAGGA